MSSNSKTDWKHRTRRDNPQTEVLRTKFESTIERRNLYKGKWKIQKNVKVVAEGKKCLSSKFNVILLEYVDDKVSKILKATEKKRQDRRLKTIIFGEI